MGLLARSMMIGGLAAAGCYEPELRDCTLACSTENDCASGQVCGADKFCAVPEMAGRCFERQTHDAGVVGDLDGDIMVATDAAVQTPVDAMPDTPPSHGTFTVQIDGKGFVHVENHGTCDSDPPQDGTCVFTVPLGMLVTVRAFADNDWRFDRWTTSACPVSGVSTCTFSPLLSMQVGVKFRRNNGGGGGGDDD